MENWNASCFMNGRTDCLSRERTFPMGQSVTARKDLPRRLAGGSRGFTLIELIVVIMLVGILSSIGGIFISRPIEVYVALSRRPELVDSADTALRQMQWDIRQALPNSIRVDSTKTRLELMHTVDGGRYRAQVDPALGGNILDFTMPKTYSSFDVMGSLNVSPPVGKWVAIYNLSPSGGISNAYAGAGTSGDDMEEIAAGINANEINLTSTVPFEFPFSSPYQRFFVVDGPVSYVCSGGTLTRYSGYTPGRDNTLVGSMGAGTLMANHVSSCSFTYAAGTSQRAGLVTLQMTLTDSGETITLLHQVHVENAP